MKGHNFAYSPLSFEGLQGTFFCDRDLTETEPLDLEQSETPVHKDAPTFDGIIKVKTSDPTEQESDLMERMQDGTFVGNPETLEVQLVSLGCSCGPKLSFKNIGRGAETLPFDWARTKVEALLTFIGNDFDGFFDTAADKVKFPDNSGTVWTAFRSPIHSFWHDDPNVPEMRERYTRRIDRFLSIDAESQPVLFVRGAATTDEISSMNDLLQLLVAKFGEQASLLVIVDFQKEQALGPCTITGLDNLLLWSFDTRTAPSMQAPYGQIVNEALEWAIGEPLHVRQFSTLQEFQQALRPTDHGLYGAMQVPAFV
jgi:hypothetical protein